MDHLTWWQARLQLETTTAQVGNNYLLKNKEIDAFCTVAAVQLVYKRSDSK